MKKTKLDAPLRIYWDVNYKNSTEPILEKEDVLKIADRIISCKPFFVNLGEDILNYEHLNDLLEKFKEANIKLSLSSSNLIENKKDYSFLKKYHIDFLEFKLNPHIKRIRRNKSYLNKINDTLEIYAGITKKVCPSLVVTSKNISLLPYLLDFFVEHKIKYFKMPNTFINDRDADNVSQELLKFNDLKKLNKVFYGKIDYYKSHMKFFIHDLFIYKIFFPSESERKERAEYGGCQAGNALCYIDQKGGLYFCSSLYISLGSVLKHSIKELFRCDKRSKFRKKIEEQFAKKCIRCIDFSDCQGGCRGVVYFINESFLVPDPLCPHVKKCDK